MSTGTARRTLTGAVLLDFAISPLFIWDTFSGDLASAVGVASHSVSIAFSIGLASFTAGVLLGGAVADRVSPRRLAALVGFGVVLGLVLSAVAAWLPVLVLGFGILLGGSTGFGYATAVRVAGMAVSRRGTAMAIVVAAYAAGAVVLAPVADRLSAAVGHRAMLLILALLLGVLTFGAAALLPGRTTTRVDSDPPDPPEHRPARVVLPLWVMFSLGSAPALIAFAHAGALAGPGELTVAAVALLNAGNFLGRLLAGPAADLLGERPVMHATAAILLASSLTLTWVDHPMLGLAALLALGTQYGALSVLTPLATSASVPATRFGTYYGVVFSGWGVVGLLGPIGAAWTAAHADFAVVSAGLVGIALLAWGAVFWAQAARRGLPSQ